MSYSRGVGGGRRSPPLPTFGAFAPSCRGPRSRHRLCVARRFRDVGGNRSGSLHHHRRVGQRGLPGGWDTAAGSGSGHGPSKLAPGEELELFRLSSSALFTACAQPWHGTRSATAARREPRAPGVSTRQVFGSAHPTVGFSSRENGCAQQPGTIPRESPKHGSA